MYFMIILLFIISNDDRYKLIGVTVTELRWLLLKDSAAVFLLCIDINLDSKTLDEALWNFFLVILRYISSVYILRRMGFLFF